MDLKKSKINSVINKMNIKNKKKISKASWESIYKTLDRVSPIATDCGVLCGAACCKSLPDMDMVMYMMPGEELLHDIPPAEEKYAYLNPNGVNIDMSNGIPVACDGDNLRWSLESSEEHELTKKFGKYFYTTTCDPEHCKRELRPLQCRTYPLTPYISEDGEFSVILDDIELPYICPLIKDRYKLNDDFIETTYKVWEYLIQDPRIKAYVKQMSEERRDSLEEK